MGRAGTRFLSASRSSVIKAPPEVAECWFDESCQRWREQAWCSKKDHYITGLLHYCAFLLWELALCFFFFFLTPSLYHTPAAISPFPSSLPLFLLYPLHNLYSGNTACQRFLHSLVVPLFSPRYCTFSFSSLSYSEAEKKTSALLSSLGPRSPKLNYVFAALAGGGTARGQCFVCVIALVLFN